jgi:predicted HTH transcriptional regulator
MAKIIREKISWRSKQEPDGMPYCRLPRSIQKDIRLNSDCKMIMAELCSHDLRSNYEITKKHLMNLLSVSHGTYDKAMSTLKRFGYIKHIQKNGKHYWEIIVDPKK